MSRTTNHLPKIEEHLGHLKEALWVYAKLDYRLSAVRTSKFVGFKEVELMINRIIPQSTTKHQSLSNKVTNLTTDINNIYT